MLALIDGDLLVYRVGFTTEDDEEWIARVRLRDMIGGILEKTNTDDSKIYLSDSKDNWRLKYFPRYKANRVAPKPKHLTYLQNLIVEEWGAEVAWGQEADDALGITQTQGNNTIVCSIDKDLLQIPGYHYNFVKQEIKFVTPQEGLFRFYEQILTGDSSDNITVGEGLSCKGIGPKKAYKMLEGCETEEEMMSVVRHAYYKAWQDEANVDEINQKLLTTGIVIKIRQKENEIWTFPKMDSPMQDLQGEQTQLSCGTQEQGISPS